MSSSEWPTLHRAWQEAGGKWSSTIIWAKNTFALGRADYHQQFEAMLYGWKAGVQHYWCGARDQGNVWHFDKPARNDLYPTRKPVALVERAIRNSSKPRDTVLDCFGRSGTTMSAMISSVLMPALALPRSLAKRLGGRAFAAPGCG
jgi:DNA modification methylase